MRFVPPALVSLTLSMAAACAHQASATSGPAAKSLGGLACPAAVAESATKAFPGATIRGCKPEHEDGRDQFEVKLDKSGADKIEADVAPDGSILQTEQAIPLAQIAARVMTAFNAKYPSAKPTRAEKQVRTGKGTFYELKFAADATFKEVTFAEDGTFVEEE